MRANGQPGQPYSTGALGPHHLLVLTLQERIENLRELARMCWSSVRWVELDVGLVRDSPRVVGAKVIWSVSVVVR